jgi:hypothetical protein
VAVAVRRRPSLDDALLLQLSQPRDQDNTHSALEIVEGLCAGHQLPEHQGVQRAAKISDASATGRNWP